VRQFKTQFILQKCCWKKKAPELYQIVKIREVLAAVAPDMEMTLEAQSISEWVQGQALFYRDFEISFRS